jgi:hypothetical protein
LERYTETVLAIFIAQGRSNEANIVGCDMLASFEHYDSMMLDTVGVSLS